MAKQVDIVNNKAIRGEDTVLELVHVVMHQFRSQQHRALSDGMHGITHMESKVMGFFARRPGATQSDLVQHSGRDKAQLARLIKGLRERGLLSAEADTEDRRTVRLHATDAGLALQRALAEQGRAIEARAVAGLSADERLQLKTLLARVKANLDAAE